jgi:two-component system nitrate/nitrite sensor histidine kinase NarX
MNSTPDSQSIGRLVAQLIPRPIGWSQSERDSYRKKFVKIIGGLVVAAIATGITGFYLIYHPQHVTAIWVLQLFCLVALLGFVLAALAGARKCFFEPLGHIRQWASEIREGNFSARVPSAREHGFAGLADDVNRLAEWLESLANDAEEQLRQQAERLASKSQSLRLLCDASALINEAPSNEELVGQYLGSLHGVLETRMGRAFLASPNGMRLVSTVGAAQKMRGGADTPGPSTGSESDDGKLCKVEVPLEYKERILGKYELFFDGDSRILAPETYDLLPSIGRHLGMAIEKTRLEQEASNLSAMEERAQVANELHDSLAQTLAGLKFQIRVLDENIAQGDESSIWGQMERVENSLEEATLELRDLIAEFRGRDDSCGKNKSIDHIINQFRRGSDIQLVFHDRWQGVRIPPELERQAARVIQEALANAQKHSQASTVRVLLRRESDSVLEAIVEDDGVGFDQPATSAHPGEHLGLTIMTERAEHVGGTLLIDSEPGEGTRVTLRLRLPQQYDPMIRIAGAAG